MNADFTLAGTVSGPTTYSAAGPWHAKYRNPSRGLRGYTEMSKTGALLWQPARNMLKGLGSAPALSEKT